MRESNKKRTRRSKWEETKLSHFSDKTVTSLGRRLEKQYGIDHRKEKHVTREEGCTSSENENCDSKIERSEASCKVENQKSENAQALNKIHVTWASQFNSKNKILKLIIFLSFLEKYFILRQHALWRTLNLLLNFLQVTLYTILM